jgi:hypothetical protein
MLGLGEGQLIYLALILSHLILLHSSPHPTTMPGVFLASSPLLCILGRCHVALLEDGAFVNYLIT